jgi:isopentenyl-diphosphate Delta-isomerase
LSASEEYGDVVDEKDNIIEKRPLGECVNLGLLHRAILVVLLDATMKKVYLQKRSEKKNFFPGRWSASCTGHVSSGESYLQAAEREVSEELGLTDVKLQPLFKFLSPKWKFGNRIEWEYITVFEGNTFDQEITLDATEVQEGKYVTLEELRDLLKANENSFTPDSIIALQRYHRLVP